MKKSLLMLSFAALALSRLAYADDAAITHSLARLGVHNAEIQPAPVAGLKTVLTESGVLYVSDDGKHVIQGPMYDVSGNEPVNVTNQLLTKRLNALQNEMIVYKAPQQKHVITIFTDITCGYCHKLHEQMKDYNALGITSAIWRSRARASTRRRKKTWFRSGVAPIPPTPLIKP